MAKDAPGSNIPSNGSLLSWSWERTEESSDDPNTFALYTFNWILWMFAFIAVVAIVILCIRFMGSLDKYLHDGVTQYVTLKNPLYACVSVVVSLVCLSQIVPQTLIFTRGSETCMHVIGFVPIAICRDISLQRFRGLLLIRSPGSKGAPARTSIYVKWKEVGIAMHIGMYVDNAVAVARAKYISARTGLPIIGADVRVVAPPVARKPKGKRRQ